MTVLRRDRRIEQQGPACAPARGDINAPRARWLHYLARKYGSDALEQGCPEPFDPEREYPPVDRRRAWDKRNRDKALLSKRRWNRQHRDHAAEARARWRRDMEKHGVSACGRCGVEIPANRSFCCNDCRLGKGA